MVRENYKTTKNVMRTHQNYWMIYVVRH